MSDKRGAGGTLVFAGIGLVLLLPVLYVLSTGPVMWLAINDYLPHDAASAFYSPLAFVCERSDPLRSFVIWWQDCFLPAHY